MALAPQFATHRIAGRASAAHQLELYLDIVCPFSRKQLQGVRQHVLPFAEANPEALTVIIRQVPQAWHSSSTLVHEAALGVSRALLDSGKAHSWSEAAPQWRDFFYKLIDEQEAFHDEPTAVETPNQTRERLADYAEVVGVDRKAFLEAVKAGKGNGGTSVTSDLKLQIKFHRTRGIHVTPTVALDGLIEPSISSSFSGDDWRKFIEDKVLPPGSKFDGEDSRRFVPAARSPL
ncbi:hypothetical protein JCM10908_004126 [Rhodotorula pacifica]|uniref:DsbA family protein n=1 Tax=Rhodotorula pacifica TaxID=1495444 RepID=UPI0031716356